MDQTSQKTVQKLVTPNDQFVRDVFSKTRSYHIDIYQREYKWDKDQVNTLLNDIEIRFEQGIRSKDDPDGIKKDVLENFEPYFLNTYLTHTTPSFSNIVDGQQRLTTLLLMLIKMYRILSHVETFTNLRGRTLVPSALKPLIYEEDDFGRSTKFKIHNSNREKTLQALVNGDILDVEDQTQEHLIDNYDIISRYYDIYFKSDNNPSGYDLIKLNYYIIFLLDRISIVEIRIELQKNVAMIFEVVNDRGLGLKPYEILKGKLIGNLPDREKEDSNKVWVELQNLYYLTELKNTTESKIDLDNFFRTFFRAKFANSEKEYESFEKEYHYEIYRRQDIKDYFKDFKDYLVLSNRIKNEINYFAKLYQELRADYSTERSHLFYNKLLDQNQQYMLIMSAVTLNDPEKEEKIKLVSAKFDQLHVILRLLDSYDSKKFQLLIYDLNVRLRDIKLDQCKDIFDKVIIDELLKNERIDENFTGSVSDLFEYNRFKNIRNTLPNFSKYILMRIDRWLADLLDKPSYCKESFPEVEDRFNRTGRKRYGMHLEHIYARNDLNKKLFTDENGLIDEAAFDQTRNLLGMVLLLKDLQNISSGADVYKKKLKDYKKSNIIWNEILAGVIPSVDIAVIPIELNNITIEPDNNGVFPKDKVDYRQRLVFEAIKNIWGSL